MITPRLSEAALHALRNATITTTSIIPPSGRLDRVCWLQLNAACALLAGGGRWNPDLQGWLFTRDPRPDLAAFLSAQAGGDTASFDLPGGGISVAAGAGNPNVHCEVPHA